MEKYDFLTKEFVTSYVISTMTEDRQTVKPVCINGRWYDKYGTEQAVTYVGNVYKVFDNEQKKTVTLLHVGMSKQNPKDLKLDKQLATEYAQRNAFERPIMTVEVGDYFNFYAFRDLVEVHLNTLRLQFVKTRQELENDTYCLNCGC